MSFISLDFGEVMAWLRIVVICFTEFCLSPPNESEGTVGFGSANRSIISTID